MLTEEKGCGRRHRDEDRRGGDGKRRGSAFELVGRRGRRLGADSRRLTVRDMAVRMVVGGSLQIEGRDGLGGARTGCGGDLKRDVVDKRDVGGAGG